MSTTSAPPQNFQSQESFALARGFLVRSTADRLADHETVGATYSTPGARKCSKPTQRYAYARADSSVRARAKLLHAPPPPSSFFVRARASRSLSPLRLLLLYSKGALVGRSLSLSRSRRKKDVPPLKQRRGCARLTKCTEHTLDVYSVYFIL